MQVPITPAGRALPVTLLRGLVLLAALVVLAPVAAFGYDRPPEAYSGYQPQRTCNPVPKPGTQELTRWINRTFGGGTASGASRACSSGGVSEHKDGRAIDWPMNAAKAADRREVDRFLAKLFATDAQGNPHALARRMGVMYVIWNDRMYASYRKFEKQAYLNAGCTKVAGCSPTLRHRDHVHISLRWSGARAETSWYAARR